MSEPINKMNSGFDPLLGGPINKTKSIWLNATGHKQTYNDEKSQEQNTGSEQKLYSPSSQKLLSLDKKDTLITNLISLTPKLIKHELDIKLDPLLSDINNLARSLQSQNMKGLASQLFDIKARFKGLIKVADGKKDKSLVEDLQRLFGLFNDLVEPFKDQIGEPIKIIFDFAKAEKNPKQYLEDALREEDMEIEIPPGFINEDNGYLVEKLYRNMTEQKIELSDRKLRKAARFYLPLLEQLCGHYMGKKGAEKEIKEWQQIQELWIKRVI